MRVWRFQNLPVESRRRAHDFGFALAGPLQPMSHFAYTVNWNESLGKGAPQPGGPLAVTTALVPPFDRVPPGTRHKHQSRHWLVEATGSLQLPKPGRNQNTSRKHGGDGLTVLMCILLRDAILYCLCGERGGSGASTFLQHTMGW